MIKLAGRPREDGSQERGWVRSKRDMGEGETGSLGRKQAEENQAGGRKGI